MTGESRKWMKFRIAMLLAFFLVLFTALVSRAFQLQILSGKALKALAQKQHTQTLLLQPERGIIFDRNGEKMAATIMADSVFADPSKIENPREVAGRLAVILQTDKAVLQKKLSGTKNFRWLARGITPEQASLVQEMGVDGIIILKEPKRYYPSGEVAGHLIGFVGIDATGLEGLELRYDRYLKGAPEKLIWTRDAKGKRLYPRVERPETVQKENYHLVLTIDNRIQHLVESHLKAAVKNKGAKGGFAIVMDPKTGEILALANELGFDPNRFSSVNLAAGKNKAITDSFDPGSTFKPFLVAAALEEGVVKETDLFNCENGSYTIADRVFREAQRKRHGALSVHDILKYSSNIGSIKIAEKLGKERFSQYIRKFGFGAKTGIDLPGEVRGLLRPVEKWTRVDAAAISFGQGISVTAIQLITALSSIANQGLLMKPLIVRGLMDRNGNLVQTYQPSAVRRVISRETAKRLTAILTDVVGMEDGTGKHARIVNVAVAGKTGTSQKFDFAQRAYSSERVKTSFMGFFPAEDPQIAILVVLDEPQRDRWGGVAAAPVFKNIGEQLLTCFKTNIRENPVGDTLPQGVPEGKPVSSDMKVMLASVPAPPTDLSGTETDETTVPNFRGMTIREVIKKSKENGIDVRVIGSGWAIAQQPAAGMPAPEDRFCTVTFGMGS
ncbi:MAG: PASTA domain-containing protein [Proteobacteria bacterium]|nr:PASTA domain-containing protein [Pseudomonadota bacterium]MBU4581010.1 PASTA domain-containing protein [Pseudomonadota bacterium]MCG2739131.1 PASTA domain-containing protein [Syntrophaceae bacterium]